MKLGVFLIWISGALIGQLAVNWIPTTSNVGEGIGWLIGLVLFFLPLYFGIKRIKKLGKVN